MRMVIHQKRIVSLVLVVSLHLGSTHLPEIVEEWQPGPTSKNVTSSVLQREENTGIHEYQKQPAVTLKELFRFQREAKKTQASRSSSGYRDDRQNQTVVEAQVGKSASINCYTKYKGGVQVSWLRPHISDIITVGASVFSRSGRYELREDPEEGLWQLIITNVRSDDEGIYECQLATSDPVSLFFNLTVKESRAVIQSPPEVTLYQGQKLELNCTVVDALDPPNYIIWLLDGSVIPRMIAKTATFSKTLRVRQVGPEHSGVYSCDPYLAIPATVRVNVISGNGLGRDYGGSRMGDMSLDTEHFGDFGLIYDDFEAADDWPSVYMQEASSTGNRVLDDTTWLPIHAFQFLILVLTGR